MFCILSRRCSNTTQSAQQLASLVAMYLQGPPSSQALFLKGPNGSGKSFWRQAGIEALKLNIGFQPEQVIEFDTDTLYSQEAETEFEFGINIMNQWTKKIGPVLERSAKQYEIKEELFKMAKFAIEKYRGKVYDPAIGHQDYNAYYQNLIQELNDLLEPHPEVVKFNKLEFETCQHIIEKVPVDLSWEIINKLTMLSLIESTFGEYTVKNVWKMVEKFGALDEDRHPVLNINGLEIFSTWQSGIEMLGQFMKLYKERKANKFHCILEGVGLFFEPGVYLYENRDIFQTYETADLTEDEVLAMSGTKPKLGAEAYAFAGGHAQVCDILIQLGKQHKGDMEKAKEEFIIGCAKGIDEKVANEAVTRQSTLYNRLFGINKLEHRSWAHLLWQAMHEDLELDSQFEDPVVSLLCIQKLLYIGSDNKVRLAGKSLEHVLPRCQLWKLTETKVERMKNKSAHNQLLDNISKS